MSKQTAVDILYKFLYEMESFEGFDPYNFNQEEVFAKAKAMEKEHLCDFYMRGGYNAIFQSNQKFDDLYNETFKAE